jgi:hypothetical protein
MNRSHHPTLAVCLLLVLGCACDEPPTGPSLPVPAPQPTALPTPTPTPVPTPEPGPTPIPGCEYDPPLILAPADGATVSGKISIVVEVPEYPCIMAATTYITVVDGAGVPVYTACALLGDYPKWDTTKVPNGLYAIRTQRSCSCSNPTCDRLGGPVRVRVLNP